MSEQHQFTISLKNKPPGSLIGVIFGCIGVREGCMGVSLPVPLLWEKELVSKSKNSMLLGGNQGKRTITNKELKGPCYQKYDDDQLFKENYQKNK